MMKPPSPRVLLTVGALAVGLAAGIALGRTALAPNAVPTIRENSLCGPYGEDQIKALLPRTPFVTSNWNITGRVPDGKYSTCDVTVKGGQIQVTTETFGGTAGQWKTEALSLDPEPGRKGTPFTAGDSATAWQNAAISYVACPAVKTNFGISVVTQGSTAGSGAKQMAKVEALTRAFADEDLPIECIKH